MSLQTEKIMDSTTKTKTCRTCDHTKKLNTTPRKRDCRKNHSGSSKAMEPTAAVDFFVEFLITLQNRMPNTRPTLETTTLQLKVLYFTKYPTLYRNLVIFYDH